MTEIISGRYKVKRLLGEGALSKVYLVSDKRRGDKPLALKLLRTPGARPLELLRHEFSILISLQHPNLAKAHDFGFDPESGFWYYTCEYIEGTEITRTCKKLSFSMICSVFAQALRALAYLHSRGIIHYDLKPAHLIVEPGGVVRIIDFGLAIKQAPFAGTMRGTVGYAAPEVVLGERGDLRADLYSLGIVMYEAVTGRRPFEEESALELLRKQTRSQPPSLRKFRRRIPEALEQVVLRLLEREPSNRYQSANEVIRALSRAVDIKLEEETSETARAYLLSGGIVGRDMELENLHAAVDSLVKGVVELPIFFITGELGVGKSRLLDEIGNYVQLQGVNLVRGSCGTLKGVPFGPFGEAVNLSRSVAAITKDAGTVDRAVTDERSKIINDTAIMLIEGTERQPMVLLIDDLEEADEDVLALLEHIIRIIWFRRGQDREPCLLILCACDNLSDQLNMPNELIDRLTSAGLAGRTRLAPLSRENAGQMLSNMFGRTEIPAQAVDMVLESAGGNPLVVEQVAAQLVESGAVFHETGKWRTSAALVELHPPAGGEESLRQKIEMLCGNELAVAEALACVGLPVEFELLCAGAEITPDACAAALTSLMLRRLIVSDEKGMYAFANRPTAEVVLKKASRDHLTGLHRRIFFYLDRTAGKGETNAGFLERAIHGERAGLDEKKLMPLLWEAVRRAEAAGAAKSTIQIYEALRRRLPEESREWFGVLERLSDLYWRSAKTDKVIENLYLARREVLWRYPEIAVKIVARFVAVNIHSGKLEEAEQFVNEAMERLKEPALQHLQARVAVQKANILEADGKMKESREFLVEARTTALQKDDYETLENIDYQLVLLDFRLRRLEDSGDRATSALKRGTAFKFYPGLHNLLGLVNREKGNSHKALEEFNTALQLYEKEGNLSAMSYVHSNTGLVLYDNGEYEKALDAYTSAKQMFRILGDDIAYGSVLVSIGKAHLAAGRTDEALALFEEALKVEQSAASPVVELPALVCRALALEVLGKTGAALEDLNRARKLARKSETTNIEALILYQRAGILAFLCGDIDGAQRELSLARSLAATDFLPVLAEILTLSARLSVLEGKLDEANKFISDAHELDISGPSRITLESGEAEVLIANGKSMEARELLNSLAKRNLSLSDGVMVALLQAQVEFESNDYTSARKEAIKALGRARQAGNVILIFDAAIKATEFCTHEGDLKLASQNIALAQQVFDRIASELPKKYNKKRLRSATFYSRLVSLNKQLRDSESAESRVSIAAEDLELSREELKAAGVDDRMLMRDGLALLGMVTRLAAADLEVQTVLSLALGMVLDITQAQRGFIVLVDREGNLQNLTARNIQDEEVTSPEYQTSHTMVKKVIKSGKPYLVADAALDKLLRNAKSVVDLKLRSVACVPILRDKRTIGVVYLDTASLTRTFTEADVILIEAFAERVEPIITHALEKEQLHLKLDSLQKEIRTRYAYTNIVGRSKPMQEIFRTLDAVTDTDITVYIYGKTGTGKELVAKALHYNSRRKNAPFVSLNCAALPEPLLESELFGYAKGAFTGAQADKPGLIEAATGGSLFLDEIGIMPLEMQVKLLRVIEEQKVRPVGSIVAKPVNVRIMCASNTPLEELVEEEKFREDLFYRLNVVKIELPLLHERREDIPLLVEHFLREFAKETQAKEKQIEKEAIALLYTYNYPGNVRQLQNIIHQAFITSGERITVGSIEAILRTQTYEPDAQTAVARKLSVEEYMKEFILSHQNNHTETELAKLLGISRQHLYKKRKQWSIPRKK